MLAPGATLLGSSLGSFRYDLILDYRLIFFAKGIIPDIGLKRISVSAADVVPDLLKISTL
jgi:hypothetical protein